ncbi:MAG: hypothetical protein PF518_18330 [Spirochaetaceae bacterium]|nr:hypothetical protein [Spirochaetaceae bacterium]
MNKRLRTVFSIMFMFSFELSAAIVTIAPLQIHSDEIISLSGNQLSEKISLGNIFLLYSGSGGESISNILEASSYCEKEGIEYLIYGSLNRNKYHESIELRFYNHNSRSIEQVFYGRDNLEATDRLIGDIKSKINTYLIEELALYEKKTEEENPYKFSVPISAGYWFPLDGQWSDVTVSLFSIKSGILFNPFEDIISTEHLDLNFHLGCSLLYEMGMNATGYEDFYQHKLKVLMPIELSLTVREKHRISLFVSPLYQLDILSKTRNHEESKVEFSSGFGFSTGAAYHYNFSKRFSAGLSGNFDFIFYENPQITFRPEFSFLIHCGKSNKGNREK